MAKKLEQSDLTPEQIAELREIAEERRRVEREMCYSPREVLAFLNNCLLSQIRRQGQPTIPRKRLDMLTLCAGVLVQEADNLVSEKALTYEEMEVVWIAAATYVECVKVQKRDDMPFGNFSLRG